MDSQHLPEKGKGDAKYFQGERPDYIYVKDVLKYLREVLEIEVLVKV